MSTEDDILAVGEGELKGKKRLNRLELRCLLPEQWLNDTVIQGYFELLMKYDAKKCEADSNRIPSCFIGSQTYSGFIYKNQRFEEISKWKHIRDTDLFNCEKIFFPAHVGENHWSLIVCSPKEKNIIVIDSLKSITQKKQRVRYVKPVKEWLAYEWKRRYGNEDMKSNDIEWSVATGNPKQDNTNDCGVFVLVTADYLLDDLALTFSASDMNNWRIKIAYHLLIDELKYYI